MGFIFQKNRYIGFMKMKEEELKKKGEMKLEKWLNIGGNIAIYGQFCPIINLHFSIIPL